VLVLLNGSPLSCNWAADSVDAILETWYPGEEGGTAIADVLFGDYNPAGRLPVTIYLSTQDLPPYEDYSMRNRTYRYFGGPVLYPFGFGLSYSSFSYSNLAARSLSGSADTIEITVDVTNTSEIDGEEVAQLYVAEAGAPATAPVRSLAGFQRVPLGAGEKKPVSFKFSLAGTDSTFKRVKTAGRFLFSAGGCQPLSVPVSTSGYVTGLFDVDGNTVVAVPDSTPVGSAERMETRPAKIFPDSKSVEKVLGRNRN
jgi:beta-glucosidase